MTNMIQTRPLFIARIWDAWEQEIDSTCHNDLAMLENIVRGDWEGSDHARSFTIYENKLGGRSLVHDIIG